MPTATTTKHDWTKPLSALLAQFGACEDGVEWAKAAGCKTAAEAWEACERPAWMLWALEQIGYCDEKLRLWACWCARETPLPDGRKTWDLLTDERSRAAVEVAERFAAGKATEEERSAARSAAWSAAWSSWSAAESAARSAAWSSWSTAESAARSAAWSAAESAAWSAQCKALRSIVGNPFSGKAKRRKAVAK